MVSTFKRTLVLGALGLSATSFGAGTITASFTYSYTDNVHYTLFGTQYATLHALTTGTYISGSCYLNNFPSYCAELGQTVPPATPLTYDCYDLLGSTTNPGGITGPITFTPAKTTALECLWGTYFPLVDTQDESRAFQLAQWEIIFGTDLTLLNSADVFYGWDLYATPGVQLNAYSQVAETWLASIAGGTATQKQKLLLLSSANDQDLITPVPEPGTILAVGAGLAMVIRRRRK